MTKKILVGNDLVHIPRFERSLQVGNFIQKIFHPNEILYCEKKVLQKSSSYAARYAAKEAFSKALGTGLYAKGVAFTDIWIENEESGRPFLNIAENIKILLKELNIDDFDISLSHHIDYAMATVILFRN
ncbi:holo-ACP synthase [Fluviispira multicolorata]|uniref:Holo-[acyl-carrier-protein] synthase n=1 Tax=Fluviispira multicolorata TaxID=2654512 RepID=A0A833JF38_9BACT|nr:holo-ACP synthase [Fluviispira multicolorata]KAB8033524.1 holo-[acyl-carrier-protein] synthase [Fluviispira multicolorata]